MSLPHTITTIGDKLVIQSGPFEQVTGIRAWAIWANYLSATRTIDTRFRWSNDGTTFSTWQQITPANLQGIAPDEDSPFYIDTEIERTGSDATGGIEITGVQYDFTYNPSAVSGHGVIDQPYKDLPELIIAVIEQNLMQLNGGDLFDVLYANPEDCKPDHRSIVYINGLSVAPVDYDRTHVTTHRVAFRCGVSRLKEQWPLDDATMRQQVQNLLFLFAPTTANQHSWNITFKGIVFTGAKWSDFGLRSWRLSSQTDIYDPDNDKLDTEFQVSVELEFNEIFALNFQ